MISDDSRAPEEVLKPEYLQAYETAHNDIYHRLIHINTSIQILETISSYPLKDISGPDDPFFEMLYWNFTYTCVVMLHALLDDPKGYTLFRFKNDLRKTWISEEEKKDFNARIKQTRFSKMAKILKERAAGMRQKVIAHRDADVVQGLLTIPGLSIRDLRKLFDETETLFAACSFRSEYGMSLYAGGTVGGQPIETDIERLMKLILKHGW